MQVVVAQQDRGGRVRVATPADELRAVCQRTSARDLQSAVCDSVLRDIRVRPIGQRRRLIEEGLRPRNHPRTTFRIIALAARQIAQRIGAIQRIIQAAPTGVHSVQRIARIHHRNHQLWSGRAGNLGIDVLRFDLEGCTLWHQIPDLTQKRLIRRRIMRLPAPLDVPRINLALHLLADSQQLTIARTHFVDQLRQPAPERRLIYSGAGQRLMADEVLHFLRNLQAFDFNPSGHRVSPN